MRVGRQSLILLLCSLAALPSHSQPQWREVVELQVELHVFDMERLQAVEALLQGPSAPAYGGRCRIERSLNLNQPAHPQGVWWLGARCELPTDGEQARRLRKDLRTLDKGSVRLLRVEQRAVRLFIPPPTNHHSPAGSSGQPRLVLASAIISAPKRVAEARFSLELPELSLWDLGPHLSALGETDCLVLSYSRAGASASHQRVQVQCDLPVEAAQVMAYREQLHEWVGEQGRTARLLSWSVRWITRYPAPPRPLMH